jgi:hypothetical protein
MGSLTGLRRQIFDRASAMRILRGLLSTMTDYYRRLCNPEPPITHRWLRGTFL